MDEIQKHGQMKDAEEEAEQRGARTRSPAYPGISLEGAIKRTRELYIQDKMNPVPLAIVVKRWGYKPKSSAGLITAAALKSFGLVRDSGTGSERKLQVTERAHKFFLDTRQDSQERDQIIKDAALSPKIHSSLWKKWGTDLPSDETLDHALKADWAFNPNSVSDFIKEYKDTIRFAKLTKHDSLSASNGDNDQIKIDDKVQASSPGNESETHVQAIKHLALKVGMNSDTFTLDEGQVILQWPAKMSPESYEDFKSWLDLVSRKAKRAADKYADDLV